MKNDVHLYGKLFAELLIHFLRAANNLTDNNRKIQYKNKKTGVKFTKTPENCLKINAN